MTKTKKYRRVGRCDPKKCGAFCCRIGPILYNIPIKKNQKKETYDSFFSKFGWSSQKIGKSMLFYPNQTCKHLVNLRCGLGNKKPKVPCKVFPQDKNRLWYKLAKKNGCTYRFVEVKTKTGKKHISKHKEHTK